MAQPVLSHIGRLLARVYAAGLLELDIQRQAPLPDGPCLLAANHPSTLDPLLIALVAGRPARILISDSVFQVPLVGRYLRAAGHIPVVADRGREAFLAARSALEAGGTVVIFPEGAISPLDGRFHRLRSGLARLALDTGAPVVPAGIALDRARLHLTELQIAGKTEIGTWYLRGPYAVSLGRPLRFAGDPEDRARVAQVSNTLAAQIALLAGESAYRMHGAYGGAQGMFPPRARG
ncbi:MAG TPA: lysophospholipid acyltransferase family protein [Roseiflexaceae bacterium]|nr:lysophospholipid acyltransferase family protein [Roseiflexaceae bacterium]